MGAWRTIGLVSCVLAVLLLLAEHALPQGTRLSPTDHWLSEYVLSPYAPAQWIMRAAFLALAASALAAAALTRHTLLFGLTALGLAAMPFLDTYPNDGQLRPMWPPTAGNMHQEMLYLAIGAALIGMGLYAWRQRDLAAWGLFGLAFSATVAQTALVAESAAHHEMTHFGGITERTIVAVMLIWVLRVCVQSKAGAPLAREAPEPPSEG